MTASQLWDWAAAAYAQPGVADECVALQDHHDQSVPLLLWAAWSAAKGCRPDADTIEAACDTARAWQITTTAPLRAVRRTLKAPVPDIDDAARLAIREQVKAVELASERQLMAALEALWPMVDGPPRPFVEGMSAVTRVWSAVTPRAALIRLADRLLA